MIEISGMQSSGKSTLAFHAIRECQKLGKKAVYFDLENAVDMSYMQGIGVEVDKVIIPYPRCGEEAIGMITKFIELDVGLIVIDSVPNLIPRTQLENDLDKGAMRIGSHAALMSVGLRKIKNKMVGKQTVVIFINQLRNNITTGYAVGPQHIPTGGMALQYEADLCIRLRSRERLDREDGKGIFGLKIEAKVTKNKFSKPFGVTEIELIPPYGIVKSREVFRMALEKGIVRRAGAVYFYGEQALGRGSEATIDFLEDGQNLSVFESIEREVIESFDA